MAKKKAPAPTVSHAKAAESIIASKTDVPVPTNVFMAAMATAQVHATLALAEQQRIANLLTMASFSHDAGDGQRLFTGLEGAQKWRLEAAEALGLS